MLGVQYETRWETHDAVPRAFAIFYNIFWPNIDSFAMKTKQNIGEFPNVTNKILYFPVHKKIVGLPPKSGGDVISPDQGLRCAVPCPMNTQDPRNEVGCSHAYIYSTLKLVWHQNSFPSSCAVVCILSCAATAASLEVLGWKPGALGLGFQKLVLHIQLLHCTV